MIKFLAEKKYNRIDVLTMIFMTLFIAGGQYLIAGIVAVVGAVVSGVLWAAYNETF